eukprot:1137420-Pelagomonas_calceolata.AAC.5
MSSSYPVPRYAFNKESIVVIANKDDPAAGAAVSALVRSMASKGQVAGEVEIVILVVKDQRTKSVSSMASQDQVEGEKV